MLKLIPLGFGLLGLLFVLVGAVVLRGPRRMRRTGMRVTGTIVGHDLASPSWNRHSIRIGPVRLSGWPYARTEGLRWPIIVFETTEGREIRTTSSVASSMPSRKGSQVTVMYDPADPQRAIVDRPQERGCIGIPFVLFGGFVAVLGFTVFFSLH